MRAVRAAYGAVKETCAVRCAVHHRVDRVPELEYHVAKVAQERTHRTHSPGLHILRAAHLHEFPSMAIAWGRDGGTTTIDDMLSQPVAVGEIARVLLELATGERKDAVVELAGPQREHIAQLVSRPSPHGRPIRVRSSQSPEGQHTRRGGYAGGAAGFSPEGTPKLSTRADTELGGHLAQVVLGGLRANEQLTPDLRVRVPASGQLTPHRVLLTRPSGELVPGRTASDTSANLPVQQPNWCDHVVLGACPWPVVVGGCLPPGGVAYSASLPTLETSCMRPAISGGIGAVGSRVTPVLGDQTRFTCRSGSGSG